MIITIAGEPGAGDTTVAKIVAKKTGYKLVRVGDLAKEIAKKQGKTILQLMKENEKDLKKLVEFNKQLDSMQKKLAKENTNIIFNSRLGAFHNPQADIKILLIAELETRAKRVAQRDKATPEKVIKKIKEREQFERKQWRKIYCFDYVMDTDAYDKIIDTTQHTAEEVAEIIIKAVEREEE